MPEADVFEAPQGGTFHGELTQAITEAFVGNGVLADGDAYVQADGSTAMGTTVTAADTGIAYAGDTYTPASASFTHSNGPTTTTNGQDDRRVDIIYFDQSAGAYAKKEGTADPNPVPPSVPSDALLLAVVLVAHGATDLQDADIMNWRARPVSGVTSASGRAEFADGMHVGWEDTNPSTTSSPKSFTYTAGYGRDVHLSTDVTISNSSGASATEDVTVELYDGVDTTGTLLLSETKSVTVADGSSKTVTFIATEQSLDGGDYHINITQSGTDLTFDKTVDVVDGVLWSFTETASGTLELTNQHDGTVVLSVDPQSNELGLLAGAIDTAEVAANAITDTEIGTLSAGVSGAQDAGVFGALFDFPVSSTPSAGTEQSYTFDIDATTLLKLYAEANGSGGLQNLLAHFPNSGVVAGSYGQSIFAELTSRRTVSSTDYRSTLGTNGNGDLLIELVDETNNTRLGKFSILNSGVFEFDSDLQTAESTPKTVYDYAAGHVPRPQVDDQIITHYETASGTNTGYTTTDEEFVGVDTATNGATFTVTLASADVVDGNMIEVKDVAGGAQANPITINTEGTETIDGVSSKKIDKDYGSIIFISDGTNWFTSKELITGATPQNTFTGAETGSVSAGDQGVLIVDELQPDETVEVYKCQLTTAAIGAVPSGVDLSLVTFDNAGGYTVQSDLAVGDGATIYDRVTGNPVASFTNTGTSAVSVGVIVDNTTTSAVSVVSNVEGVCPI